MINDQLAARVLVKWPINKLYGVGHTVSNACLGDTGTTDAINHPLSLASCRAIIVLLFVAHKGDSHLDKRGLSQRGVDYHFGPYALAA